jgi:hypothetical protein
VVVVHTPCKSGSPCGVFGGVQVFFTGACEEVRACAMAAKAGDDATKITTIKIRVGMKNRRLMGAPFLAAQSYPVVTEDLDIVVAAEEIEALETALTQHFKVRRFPHSINVSAPPSKLQIQIQTDPRLEDILQGKIWAAMDADRRQSKRQKDLADIARILEVSPDLRERVPAELLSKLL